MVKFLSNRYVNRKTYILMLLIYCACVLLEVARKAYLYIVVLYLICLDRFTPEAMTVYTHVVYTLHILYREWPGRLPYSCTMFI